MNQKAKTQTINIFKKSGQNQAKSAKANHQSLQKVESTK